MRFRPAFFFLFNRARVRTGASYFFFSYACRILNLSFFFFFFHSEKEENLVGGVCAQMSFLRKYATGGRVYIKQAAAGHKKGWVEAKRGIQSAAWPFKCWPEKKNVKLGERGQSIQSRRDKKLFRSNGQLLFSILGGN